MYTQGYVQPWTCPALEFWQALVELPGPFKRAVSGTQAGWQAGWHAGWQAAAHGKLGEGGGLALQGVGLTKPQALWTTPMRFGCNCLARSVKIQA